MSATYLNRGYLNACKPSQRLVTRTIRIKWMCPMLITENQMVRVSNVVYLGQKVTRLSLLKKTAKVAPEEPMQRGELLEAESRLYDLNVFDWSYASVRPKQAGITDQTEEEALVKVHEAKRNEVTYGFGFEVSHRGGNIPTGTVAVPGLPTTGLWEQSNRAESVNLRKPSWIDRIHAPQRTRTGGNCQRFAFAIAARSARFDDVWPAAFLEIGLEFSIQLFVGADDGKPSFCCESGRPIVSTGTPAEPQNKYAPATALRFQ